MQLEWLEHFHFLRPEFLWLLLVLPLLWLTAAFTNGQGAWQQVISPHLLQHLLLNQGKPQRRRRWLLSLVSLLAILALSGPSFRQKPVPVFSSEAARVVVLDLSLSMNAQDIKPSRLDRAKYKLQDLLKSSQEGSVGLVVYAGDAFVISPLTNDTHTIEAMIPVLSPGIMPVLGSAPEKGLQLAANLLKNAGQPDGQIIWITDGVDADQIDPVISQLQKSQAQVAILALGTAQGAPIPLPQNNGFLKDSRGNIVVPKLNIQYMEEIAEASQAMLQTLTDDARDIEKILQQKDPDLPPTNEISEDESGQSVNRWQDDGYWLVWACLLLLIWPVCRHGQFRLFSHLVAPALLMLSLFPAQSVKASVWDDLWYTKDEQAKQKFEQQAYDQAAQLFTDQRWKGAALYKKGEFEQSLESWKQPQSSDDFYNRGNALAKAGQLQEAIKAYERAIQLDESNEDAKFNKKLIEDLLKQQDDQNKDQSQQNEDQNQQDQSQQEQNNPQNDQENQDASDKDQESEQQNQEQTQQEQQTEQQDQTEQQEQATPQQKELSEDERSEKEKDQALKHWLEKIPDDPGGLLRRKMQREYQKRGRRQSNKKVW